MIKVGVVGATGYTGAETLRLLVRHPEVTVTCVTSRSEAGTNITDTFPALRGFLDLPFVEPDLGDLSKCDVVFFATPNGTAMKMVPELLALGVKVIDLAADFRLKDLAEWEKWYGMPHACPEILAEAVYGLPEMNREQIKSARIVANPGCYPTATQLGFLPLIKHGLIELDGLIADTKSGVSGAGRTAKVGSLYSEAGENFSAYAAAGHRHLPEVVQGLGHAAGAPVGLTFVPHLVPMIRGIHATLYGKLKSTADLQDIFESFYKDEPFVDVMPAGLHPQTKSVRGSNQCRIAVYVPQGGKQVVVLSVIDNLVKGAAGQAVQNMNIMFGFEETQGLEIVPLAP